MTPRPFHLRAATAADAPAFVRLVRALAEFERLPGPDDAAAERLAAHLADGRHFELLLAEVDGEVVGYALYFMTYSTFRAAPSLYLEDLFVLPAERGRGIGAAFLRRLAELAVGRGCGRFEWTVLDWNQGAIDFYTRLGARILDDWRVCRLDGEALARLGGGAARDQLLGKA